MKSFAACALLLAVACPAAAQDVPEDWDLGRAPDQNLTIAAVSFENFGVAVRCRNGILGVMVSGLPPAAGVRRIGYSMAGSPEKETTWVGAGEGRTAFAIWPASVARDLRHGGRLSLGVPEAGRVKRIVVDLPASPSAIGQVFEACDRELPNDAPAALDLPEREDMGGLMWRSAPQPSFPDTGSESGIAAVICGVDAAGALRGCRAESEFPEGGGFGRAATLGAHRTGRVAIRQGETGPLAGRRISFVVRYRISDAVDMPVTPSRLPQ